MNGKRKTELIGKNRKVCVAMKPDQILSVVLNL
jgi:hypothetical protein